MEHKVLKKNDLIELTIDGLGNDGEGIGHYDGCTLFVKDGVPGDVMTARILKMKKSYGYARAEVLLQKSKDRVEPVCPSAGQCGGCQLQHLSYEKQLEYKQDKIRDCLARIGGFREIEQKMEPIIGMEQPYHYRNKVQYPVGRNKDGKIVAGFYAKRTHAIVYQEKCWIQAEVNEVILSAVLEFLEEYHIEPYEETEHRGLVRHLMTRVGFRTGEILVCLVVNGRKLPNAEVLVDRLRKIEGIVGICLNVNRAQTNVIMGDEIIPLWGKAYITDWIGDVQFQISPLSFYQVNPVQTEKLYRKVMEFADLQGGETVWDLYCGIGTISLFLARKAGHVYGVEIVPQAIKDAKRNAALNGIDNAEFFVGAAEEVLPEWYQGNEQSGGEKYADGDKERACDSEYDKRPGVIVVDPPRKGCDQALLDTVLKMRPERVVYVSCDPATLARDLKYLCADGVFEVEKVQGVDQFGMSGHVETVVLLSKLKSAKTIEVKIELDEMDLTTAESKATYDEIKQYVFEHTGMKVSQLYVAQVKRKHGLIERANYNVGEGKAKTPQVPVEKEKAIEDALRYFKMI